jgi:carboxylate-amine ligase
MAADDGDFSIGVEEEYQIVDPVTRELRPRAGRVLPRAREAVGDEVTNELFLSQIEVGTPVCRTLTDVRTELVRLRKAVIEAARKEGSRIAASGTHPFSHWGGQPITPKPRYWELADDFQQLAREQLICGCHVHVGIADPEAVIQVMNRARAWLAPILALSANSPFWLGVDTGYASYRSNLFGRFPMTGTPHHFDSRAEFDELVASLQSAGVVEDGSFLYWDARPSSHVRTLEFRVADVCMAVDEAVLVAGLTRALARTCHGEWSSRMPYVPVRPELVRAASWRASRFGLEGELIDVRARRSVPARELVRGLLEQLRPRLEEAGDWDEVRELVHRVETLGNGARRQREALARSGRMEDVVDLILEETERGVA